MKIGYRKPSPKKSFKARTTGRAKRAVKKSVVPGYGKKGMGWVKDPKKAAYNKVYNKTTRSVHNNNSGCGCLLFLITAITMSLIFLVVL
ncbi:hypothetical protein ACS127_10165 [Amphibacillus sp. Q70]|uniref:hypothetical protein n=1 Tax=Amphibacillus sp. Q70 TaxID=3453416 RepID=UPI003F8319CC